MSTCLHGLPTAAAAPAPPLCLLPTPASHHHPTRLPAPRTGAPSTTACPRRTTTSWWLPSATPRWGGGWGGGRGQGHPYWAAAARVSRGAVRGRALLCFGRRSFAGAAAASRLLLALRCPAHPAAVPPGDARRRAIPDVQGSLLHPQVGARLGWARKALHSPGQPAPRVDAGAGSAARRGPRSSPTPAIRPHHAPAGLQQALPARAARAPVQPRLGGAVHGGVRRRGALAPNQLLPRGARGCARRLPVAPAAAACCSPHPAVHPQAAGQAVSAPRSTAPPALHPCHLHHCRGRRCSCRRHRRGGCHGGRRPGGLPGRPAPRAPQPHRRPAGGRPWRHHGPQLHVHPARPGAWYTTWRLGLVLQMGC